MRPRGKQASGVDDVAIIGFISRRGRRRGGALAAGVSEASRRIRAHLDSDRVMRTAVDEVHRALRPARATIWLTTGRDPPRQAYAVGGAGETEGSVAAPEAVLRSARRRRRVRETGSGRLAGRLAVPILAPRSGLLGVLLLEGEAWDADHQWFAEAIAHEAGFALETANLYEQAVAAKDKSEAILERVADAVVVTDVKGRIHDWNEAAERIVGCPAFRAVGQGCAEILGLRVGERALDCGEGCALLVAGAQPDSILGQEVWRLRDDGRRQPLLANVSVVTDADGNVAEVVHSLRDVTRLKEADEAKTMFLATASHELKTPLTVIQGFTELLSTSRYSTEGEREQALEAVERHARRLNKIVDRLMLSSRIEAGRAEVLPREIEVGPLLQERADTFRTSIGREILLEVEPGLPRAIADHDAVTAVVDHLLDNALKFSPPGEPVVVAASSDESWVRVSVTDSGIGMDAEQVARCFEKFWQAESSDVRRYGGTGIGLYIVRSLVEAMGGEVRAESTPGAGSTFFVSLPRPGRVPVDRALEPPKPGVGEQSVIREFMRQIGVPVRRET